jgi:hypothetical protein
MHSHYVYLSLSIIASSFNNVTYWSYIRLLRASSNIAQPNVVSSLKHCAQFPRTKFPACDS